MSLRRYLRNLLNAPPRPEEASAADLEAYQREWIRSNEREAAADARGANEASAGITPPSADADAMRKDAEGKLKSEYPWLADPSRGVRWDFDPIELRTLAQENAWVHMLVETIASEIAGVSWTITRADDETETAKRLSTHPEEREAVSKELPDETAREIADLLRNPNPDDDFQSFVKKTMADLLEVGNATTVKAFPSDAYNDDDELIANPEVVKPLDLMPSAPEVWTKDYKDKTGIIDGYWQFDRHTSPGGVQGGRGARGVGQVIHFDRSEVMWSGITERSNMRYAPPPTLAIKPFLQAIDLAVNQENEYLSRGSLPSGIINYPDYDKQQAEKFRQEMENMKGKPWKMPDVHGSEVSFEEFGYNFDEMQFTERQKWYSKVIASAFQVPTAVVGLEPEKVNYATFQGERENFESNTLGPYLQKLERWLNSNLIEPHWGSQYRFEFQPGMSESTRGMIAERVRQNFNSNLITRREARAELGKDPEAAEPDGYKDDVVEGSDDGGPLDALGASVSKGDPTAANHQVDPGEGFGLCENTGKEFECETMGDLAGDCPHCGDPISHIDEDDLDKSVSKAEYDVGDETIDLTPPDYMIEAAEAADEAEGKGWIPDSCGGEAGRGTQRKNEILNDEVGPGVVDAMATYLTSHAEDVTAEGSPSGWTEDEWSDCGNAQYAKWGGVGDGRAMEWAQRKSDDVAEARGETPTYKMLSEGGDTDFSQSRKDDAMRSGEVWPAFDVQPGEVEQLREKIADDVNDLFETVLSDDQIQTQIERLATEDDDTEKSLSGLGRRLRELLSEVQLGDKIADTIREATASEAAEAVQSAMQDADEDVDVDVQAIEARLRDREVNFANEFADRMSEQIRSTVADGFEEGLNSRQIGQNISEQGDIAEGWNGAERIARQELQIAAGEAREEVAAELDKVEELLTSEDSRVRGTDNSPETGHAALHGKWKRPGEAWVVPYDDGEETERPIGNSEKGIGCRCQSLLVDPEDVDAADYAGDGNSP